MSTALAFVLQAQGLVKTYPIPGRALSILRGADLQVAAGESVSICGESGCGKTTLLNILAGLETRDTGELWWEGQVVPNRHLPQLAARRAELLGLVFQNYHLIPELTALENVLLAARIRGAVGKVEKARANDLLAAVGLAERMQSLPAKLSGGEKQRVAVARALINRPRVVLADEPTGNLDPGTGQHVLDLLLRLCRDQGVALVLVTHSPAFAAHCQRQVRLADGVLTAVS